jgi:vanillate/3-O-methylgallate O-demethylase
MCRSHPRANARGFLLEFPRIPAATVAPEHSEPGTEVTVLWGEGETPAGPTVEDHVQQKVWATVARISYT